MAESGFGWGVYRLQRLLSSKRMNFILAEVTLANIPQVTFELLVPCFNPELSDRYDWGGASLKKPKEQL